MTTSLRSRIESAKSLKEIQSLLAEGDKYTGAASGTCNSWQKAANKRALELKVTLNEAYGSLAVQTEEPAPVKKKAAPKRKKVLAVA